MRNSILHRNCREGKDQSGLGRPKRLFKEDVGCEWVRGKAINA